MEPIYIIGNNDIASGLNGQEKRIIPFPSGSLKNDGDIHDFLTSSLKGNVGVLVLDADQDRNLCLRLAKHVRLSVESLGTTSLCPIILITELNPRSFLHPHGYHDDIDVLSTEGVYISRLAELVTILPFCRPLKPENYTKGFLNRIQVAAPDELGGHDLANQWGASVMYRLACGGEIERGEYPELEVIKKDLYMKYVTVSTQDLQTLLFRGKVADNMTERSIDAEGKRILLIDDRAQKGWEDTLKNIFVGYDTFDVISQEITEFEDYSYENQQKILFGEYDLYLLDLRLGGSKEEYIFRTEDFSGMKVLKKIKAVNKGRQVIMFTASNKAWNFKALLNPDAGANGYYIKESPSLKLPEYFSERNLSSFISDVNRCFERGYLTRYYSFINEISGHIEELHQKGTDSPYSRMLEEVYLQLQIAFNLADISTTPNMYKYAFIAAEQVLEIFASHLTEVVESEKKMNVGFEQSRIQSLYRKQNGYLYHLTTNKETKERFSQFDRLSAIYLQLCGQLDDGMMHVTRQMIQIRNSFIHPVKQDESSQSITRTDLYYRKEVADAGSLFAKDEMLHLLEELADQGVLYDHNGNLGIRMQVVDSQRGIELILMVLMNFYDAVKSIGHN